MIETYPTKEVDDVKTEFKSQNKPEESWNTFEPASETVYGSSRTGSPASQIYDAGQVHSPAAPAPAGQA